MSSRMTSCIFCKIIKGEHSVTTPSSLRAVLGFLSLTLPCPGEEDLDGGPDNLLGDIPSFKLFESDKTLAFLDIQPLSKGHAV